MTKLEFTFKNDTLFKMLFVKNPHLLKRLVSCLLNIPFESIDQFKIKNPEIPPDSLGEKFCRLDIHMMVNGRLVDIEIQVYDEGDYRERSLYYWTRDYSSALNTGGDYLDLPPVVIISIVDFKLFDSPSYYSEFCLMETTRHEILTDKMKLCYFELKKLPQEIDAYNELLLWLNLFSAETLEEIQRIKSTGVPVMKEAIMAYDSITATSEFRELERLRELARHNEASALRYAKQEERARWETIVAGKDAALAKQATLIVDKDTALANKDTALANKDAALAKQAALIAELQARLGNVQDDNGNE